MALLLLAACDDPRDDLGRGGEGSIADIAILLRSDASDEQIAQVQELLLERHPSGRGEALVDGIFAMDTDFERREIYLRVTADANRTDELAAMLQAHPLVEDVRRDFLVGSER